MYGQLCIHRSAKIATRAGFLLLWLDFKPTIHLVCLPSMLGRSDDRPSLCDTDTDAAAGVFATVMFGGLLLIGLCCDTEPSALQTNLEGQPPPPQGHCTPADKWQSGFFAWAILSYACRGGEKGGDKLSGELHLRGGAATRRRSCPITEIGTGVTARTMLH